jgi:RNA polymerase sigma factor (sigma-70 family)
MLVGMDNYVTSHTLLARALHDQDQDSWEQFFARYQRYIITLLRKLGIGPDELDDVTQEVMLSLWRRLDSYDKSRSKFRTWLAGVVRFSAMNARRKKNTRDRMISEDPVVINDRLTDENSYLKTAETEWKNFIMETALDNIRSEFSETTIRAFQMSLTEASGEAIAKELGIVLSSVYCFKVRVKKRLMEELYYLQQDLNHE